MLEGSYSVIEEDTTPSRPQKARMIGLRWIAEESNLGEWVALNATSAGVGRRNKSFLCMCNRNCIFYITILIIIISIVFVVMVMILQNHLLFVVGIVVASPQALGLSQNNPHD